MSTKARKKKKVVRRVAINTRQKRVTRQVRLSKKLHKKVKKKAKEDGMTLSRTLDGLVTIALKTIRGHIAKYAQKR